LVIGVEFSLIIILDLFGFMFQFILAIVYVLFWLYSRMYLRYSVGFIFVKQDHLCWLQCRIQLCYKEGFILVIG